MRKILAVLAAVILASTPCQASYTGLLVTSGANLYEISSGGVLTLVDTYTGVSLGALTEGAKTSTTSEIWMLSSAGTDLYKINYSLSNGIHVTTHSHRGSLGVTGNGLVMISGTLYTMVHNANGNWDLYTVSTSTGAATYSSEVWGSDSNFSITTDGTYVFIGESLEWSDRISVSSGWDGTATQFLDPSNTPSSEFHLNRAAFDGTHFWYIDNVTNKLAYGDYVATFGGQTNVHVTVTATGVFTYNGMCWGFVPW